MLFRLNFYRDKGFTLWEVMLVLVILGFLSFMVIPSFTASEKTVKAKVHEANLLQIERAVQLYYLDVGSYPADIQSLVQRPPGEEKWRGPYLEQIPEYPYEAALSYELEHGKVCLK
ncbi:MAG TPA: prepilin-type N-terminal cleavage/methylation domain-containing protein [Peptococcaceae bacterium]|nr:prepilin-type N-terminal cleavage/methylation domain-containing protein [Peptococcaceae bacterium]